ncbi:MAG: hypothetical protein NWE80_00850, partial [Candidatus Bathyarchaeota archaeon]|nr:hypothetical protein [Candidatus Bathyarchaeota archaeon]
MKKTKTETATLALILTLTITATLIALTTVGAQEEIGTTFVPEWIYASAAPNPVGVGQSVGIVIFTADMPPSTWEDPSLGAPGGRECW